MEEEKKEQEIQILPENQLGEITRAEIDTQIATAKSYPRSLKVFMDKAKSIATINQDVAESCTYALPRAGKVITGKSVRLAEIISSCYGNIRSGSRVIANDGKSITAQGICHDLENNVVRTTEIKVRITDKYGRPYSDDMQIVAGNAACAKAYRNAVFSVIPAGLTDTIWEEIKKVARGSEETLPVRRAKAIKYFKDHGISEDEICEALEIKRIEDIDLDKMTILRGMVTLSETGEMSLKEIFNKKNKKEASEEGKEASKKILSAIKNKTNEND